MANDELLTDDFVADLLAKEANDCSLKYSALGMEAYRSDKKPANMPKPNTRFLRHIIKNTDSHNKALLAREEAESKARLGDLEHATEIKKAKTNPDAKTIRRRQMGDIHAILGGKKPAERDTDKSSSSRRRDKEESSSRSGRRDRERSSRSSKDLFGGKKSDDRHHGRLSRDDKEGDRRRSDGRRRRDEGSDEDRKHRSRRHRDRSRSRSPRQKPDSRDVARSRRHRSPARTRSSPSPRRSKHHHEPISDSDPLEDLIGPAPAPKYRGRGTVAGSSGIDRRFSASYDPKADVDMDAATAGDTNWDDAVEAFRDRQKLRQSQEERLRAAGFGDEQIRKMNGEADAGEESSVRWSKAGEKREWDMGKEKERGEGGAGKMPTGLFSEFSDDEL